MCHLSQVLIFAALIAVAMAAYEPAAKTEEIVEVVEPVVVEQPVEEVKEEPAPVVKQKPVKKPRGRPIVDKFKVIEARIRGNEFHGADKSNLVIFISKSLSENPEYRSQMALLLKELGHNDVMMIFSML